VFLALAAANVANYATEGAQKRFIRSAFGQYLSPDVVNRVVDDPDQLRLGGEKRELTMFFSDIQGFTTISEALEPEQLSGFLNKYLTALVKIIQDAGGTIDKFEGDAIIAFWNAPITHDDHPVRAVGAALSCQRALSSLRNEWMAPPPSGVGVPIYTRIGLNTGEVSVGNFGSETRFDYTALGDHMNLAARLEGSNKLFGTYLLISEFTYAKIADTFPARELGRIGVVGRSEPLTVYEPMFKEEYEQRRSVLDKYETGLTAFYSGRFEEAISRWEEIAGVDAPAARLLSQAQRMAALPADQRPAEWDGVVRLSEK
jgi:adenylate cyclase